MYHRCKRYNPNMAEPKHKTIGLEGYSISIAQRHMQFNKVWVLQVEMSSYTIQNAIT